MSFYNLFSLKSFRIFVYHIVRTEDTTFITLSKYRKCDGVFMLRRDQRDVSFTHSNLEESDHLCVK